MWTRSTRSAGVGVVDDVERPVAGRDDRRAVDGRRARDADERAVAVTARPRRAGSFASGKPFGPGWAMRVGLKSGAPWKFTTAWPNRFCCGVGASSVTVCTHSGHPIARLASFGA